MPLSQYAGLFYFFLQKGCKENIKIISQTSEIRPLVRVNFTLRDTLLDQKKKTLLQRTFSFNSVSVSDFLIPVTCSLHDIILRVAFLAATGSVRPREQVLY